MSSLPIVSRLLTLPKRLFGYFQRSNAPHSLLLDPQLPDRLRHPRRLPRRVRKSPVTRRYLSLLAPLDWQRFPERDLSTNWGIPTIPYLPFVANLNTLIYVLLNLRALQRVKRLKQTSEAAQ